MKKLLLTLLVAMLALPGFARDIEYSYEDQTLTYTVIDEEAKTVRTKDGVSNTAGNEVSGNLVIPSQIKDGDETYHVVAIGEYAFYRCSGLTSITIPEAVTSIGWYAFSRCSGLTSITIPETVTSIDIGVFDYCSGLTSITIPEAVTSIGAYAFDSCSGLTSITIPEAVTSIGADAFDSCSGLTSINIPEAVTSIGEFAFDCCSGLTSITIPEAVTSIGEGAFYGCSGLNTVILPKMLETLEGGAFAECDKIRNVVYTATNPVESFSSVFVDEVYHNATLYLPSGRIEAIRSVEPWKSFRNYSDEAFCGVENVIADFNEDAPYEVFNLNGVKAAESTVNLPAGIYIVRQGNNVKKIAVK